MRMNLYISFDTKQHIDETRKKYHISLSTLARIITEELFTFYLKDEGLDLKYLDQKKRNKTSCNLKKEFYETLEKQKFESKSILISNVLYIYYNFDKLEELQKLLPLFTKEKWNKIKSKIGNRLSNEREVWWDYNNSMRSYYRARKQYEREQARKNG